MANNEEENRREYRSTHIFEFDAEVKFILGGLQQSGWVSHGSSKLNNWKTGVSFFHYLPVS